MNDCRKAERAQMDFGQKCGAESIVPVDAAFEGGVVGVTFSDDSKVNRTVWKEIVKDKDGKTIWRPNCERREGAIVAKSEKYRPHDTATRIYDYRKRTWQEVKHLFAEGKTDGEDAADKPQPTEKKYIRYIELYREDTKKSVRDMSKLQREAISLERERIMLPVVTPDRVFATLQADMTAGLPKDDKMHIIRPESPTFWKYGNHWYVGCTFPCRAEGLRPIGIEVYVEIKKRLLMMQRDLEAMAKSERRGS